MDVTRKMKSVFISRGAVVSDQTPYVIRDTRDEDLFRVHEIAVTAWQSIFARYKLIVGAEMWQDLWGNWEEGWFRCSREKDGEEQIVTEVDGQIAGFATCWYYPDNGLAWIGGNAIDPKYQKRGIGTAQIQWLIEKFRRQGYKYAGVFTGLDPAHGPARAMYRKAGFRRGIIHSRYYNCLDEVARIPIRDDLVLRWAEPADAKAVRKLARCAWEGAYESLRKNFDDLLFTVVFGEGIDRKLTKLASIISNTPHQLRLATNEQHIVGLAVLDEDEVKKLGRIETLSIHPEFRYQGVGSALCMDAFSLFRKHGLRHAQLRIKCGEMNERIQRLCWNVGLHRELPSINYYMCL